MLLIRLQWVQSTDFCDLFFSMIEHFALFVGSTQTKSDTWHHLYKKLIVLSSHKVPDIEVTETDPLPSLMRYLPYYSFYYGLLILLTQIVQTKQIFAFLLIPQLEKLK